MKKTIAIILALAVMLCPLAGCGSTQYSAPSPSSGEQPAASTEEKANEEVYEMVIALHTNEGTVESNAVYRFKDAVEEKSAGRIEVKVFPGATLGTEEENLEQIGTNEIQGSIFGDVMTSQLAADLDPTVTPFLFSSVDDVLTVWAGNVGEKINEACKENGNLRVLGVGRRGARYLLANDPITTPEECSGLKLRLPSIANWVTIWEKVGALPTPIAFSEVYTSLQTGVVDAFESTAELTYTGSYYEVVEYAIDTHHLYGLFHLAVCESWFQSLPAELQEIIMTEGAECCAWGDEQAAALESQMVQNLVDNGMEVITPDAEAFKDAAMPAIEEIVEQWQDGVWEEIEQYVA